MCESVVLWGGRKERDIWWKYKKISVGEFEFCSETQSVLNYFLLLHFAIYFFYFLEAECYVWKGGGYLIMCNLFVYFSTKQIQWVSTETLNPNILCLSPPAGVFKAICV